MKSRGGVPRRDGATGSKRGASAADRKFARVVDAFIHDCRVTRGEGKGFGAGALKADGKIFAMTSSRGMFVVKLPAHRVDALVAGGWGERFDPGHGRLMKEWLAVTSASADWIELAKEALQFVMRGER